MAKTPLYNVGLWPMVSPWQVVLQKLPVAGGIKSATAAI